MRKKKQPMATMPVEVRGPWNVAETDPFDGFAMEALEAIQTAAYQRGQNEARAAFIRQAIVEGAGEAVRTAHVALADAKRGVN